MTIEEADAKLRREFERELPRRIDRLVKTGRQQIIPNAHFAQPSSECRDAFVNGQFYACITLAQSVAEGIARFIAAKNAMRIVEEHLAQINILQRDRTAPAISETAYAAFRKIRGRRKKERDDFHHMNETVEQGAQALEMRAFECVEALYAIESEVFGFDVNDGAMRTTNEQYWPNAGENTVSVYVR